MASLEAQLKALSTRAAQKEQAEDSQPMSEFSSGAKKLSADNCLVPLGGPQTLMITGGQQGQAPMMNGMGGGMMPQQTGLFPQPTGFY